jgi:DNA-binding LacI/PurR family transcriptional regulator
MNPRKPSVTAQDVARRAGVSRAWCPALSSNGSISPDARARVLRAAEELGYQVNFLAQGLNRQRSHLIGVIVSRISDPFRSALLDALLNEIQRQGFQALVSEIHSEQDLAHTLRRFAQFRVSGVIVTSGQPPEALVNECVQQHIPVVGINRQPTIPGVDYVCSDNAAGAELAADQLLRSGCRRFGWLKPPSFHLGRPHARGSVQPGAADARSGRRTPPGDPRLSARRLRGRVTGCGARRRGAGGSFAPTPSLPVAFSMECASAAERLRRIFS